MLLFILCSSGPSSLRNNGPSTSKPAREAIPRPSSTSFRWASRRCWAKAGCPRCPWWCGHGFSAKRRSGRSRRLAGCVNWLHRKNLSPLGNGGSSLRGISWEIRYLAQESVFGTNDSSSRNYSFDSRNDDEALPELNCLLRLLNCRPLRFCCRHTL